MSISHIENILITAFVTVKSGSSCKMWNAAINTHVSLIHNFKKPHKFEDGHFSGSMPDVIPEARSIVLKTYVTG